MRRLTVQPTVLVVSKETVVFENVELSRHLTEYEHSGPFSLQSGQQSV